MNFKPCENHVLAWLDSLEIKEDLDLWSVKYAAGPKFCAEGHITSIKDYTEPCPACGGLIYPLPWPVVSQAELEESLKNIFNSEDFMEIYFPKAKLNREGSENKAASLFLLEDTEVYVSQHIEENLVIVFQKNKNNIPGFGKWLVAIVHTEWLEYV